MTNSHAANAENENESLGLALIPGETRAACFKVLLGVGAVYALLRAVGLNRLFPEDGEGVAALLAVVGTLYSVLYAFATYVIWGQFTAVESEIQKEAGSLKDLMVFSNRLKPDTREPLVRSVKSYARAVVDTEWRALANAQTIDKTDRDFSEVVSSVAAIHPQDETERVLYAQLLDLAQQASAHRDERIALSVKRMPRTLLLFVSATAAAILLLLFLFPFRNAALGTATIAMTAVLLYFARFVLTDLDNPFEGTWNVGADSFAALITNTR